MLCPVKLIMVRQARPVQTAVPVLLRRCLPLKIGASGGVTPYRAIPTGTTPNLPEEVDQGNVTHSILRQGDRFLETKRVKYSRKYYQFQIYSTT